MRYFRLLGAFTINEIGAQLSYPWRTLTTFHGSFFKGWPSVNP